MWGRSASSFPTSYVILRILKVIEKEYENTVGKEEKSNCRMILRSCQKEAKIGNKSLFDIIASEDDDYGSDLGDEFEMMTEAYIEKKDGRISVTYKEAGEGFEDVKTTVSFMENEKDIITVSRGGEGFVIEKGRRSFSAYKTPFGNIEMCVWGRNIENTMGEKGGELMLDYTVELRGMTAQKTKMTIKVIAN